MNMRYFSTFILFSVFFSVPHGVLLSATIAQSDRLAISAIPAKPTAMTTTPARLAVARHLIPELTLSISQVAEVDQPALMARLAQLQLQLGQYDQAQQTIQTAFKQLEQTDVYYSHAFVDMVSLLPQFQPWATTQARQTELDKLLQQALKLGQQGETSWQLHGLNQLAVAAGQLKNPAIGQAAITAAQQALTVETQSNRSPDINTRHAVQLVITANIFKQTGEDAQRIIKQQMQFMQAAEASVQPGDMYYGYGAASLAEGYLAIGNMDKAKQEMQTAIQNAPDRVESQNFLNELVPIAHRFPDRPTADALVAEILQSSDRASLLRDVVASYLKRQDRSTAKRILAAHSRLPDGSNDDHANQAKQLTYLAESYRLVGDDAKAAQHLQAAYAQSLLPSTWGSEPRAALYLVAQAAIQLKNPAIAQDCINRLISRAEPTKVNQDEGDAYALSAAAELIVKMPDRNAAFKAYRMMQVVLQRLEPKIYPGFNGGSIWPAAIHNANIHFNATAIAQAKLRKSMQLTRQYHGGKLDDTDIEHLLDTLVGEATGYAALID